MTPKAGYIYTLKSPHMYMGNKHQEIYTMHVYDLNIACCLSLENKLFFLLPLKRLAFFKKNNQYTMSSASFHKTNDFLKMP